MGSRRLWPAAVARPARCRRLHSTTWVLSMLLLALLAAPLGSRASHDEPSLAGRSRGTHPSPTHRHHQATVRWGGDVTASYEAVRRSWDEEPQGAGGGVGGRQQAGGQPPSVVVVQGGSRSAGAASPAVWDARQLSLQGVAPPPGAGGAEARARRAGADWNRSRV